jgi:PAS domain S-box-containing protein
VVIVTGDADLEGAIASLRHGAADYILKPINPDALRASLRRIAEHRQLALARQRSEANFRHLVEAAAVVIVILRADHSIRYFSPFAEELTGYAAREVLGKNYSELFVREGERQAVAEEIQRVLSGVPARGYENTIRCRDGTQRWLIWNARRLDDYDGEPGVLAVGHDITARKRAEERALQSERLAAIGQMVTGLAHESRNALQRSKACLEMLALELEGQPEALDLVARVSKAQDHLHHLYEEVRAYAAPIKLHRKVADAVSIARETWGSLALMREGQPFEFVEEIATPNTRLEVDEFAIGQVFRNILENAIVACPNPGRIVLRCADTHLDNAPALALHFRDNGPGLNTEQRQKIFDPFYTTKTKGTGLGMAIAKRIVDAHGGRIAVGEGPGPGAEIIVVLPRGSV